MHARSLRGWLKHLASTDRLAVAREGVSLEYELAGIAKKLETKLTTRKGRHRRNRARRKALDHCAVKCIGFTPAPLSAGRVRGTQPFLVRKRLFVERG